MVEIIPRDGKMSSQAACNQLNRTSIWGRREGNGCAFGIDHSLQELNLKLKARGLSVLLLTAELMKLERKEKEFFFFLILLINFLLI